MKFSIDIECSPEEARQFFGMPNVEPINEMIMAEMMKRAAGSMDTLADPEKFVANMMSMGGKSVDAFQSMMSAAMAGKKK